MNKATLTVLALSMSLISAGVYAQSSTSPLTLQDIQKQHTAQSQRLDNYGLLISNNLGLVNKANQDIQQVKLQQDQTQHSLSQLGKDILSSAVYQHGLDTKQDSQIASNKKNTQQLQTQIGADVARLTNHEQLIKANQQVSVKNQQAILANQKQNTQQAQGITSNRQGIQQLHSQQTKLEQTSITQNKLIAANQQEILKNQQITLTNQKQNTQQAKGITSNQQGIQQLHSQQAKLEQTSITQNNLIAANQQEILKSQQITLANQKQNTQQAKGITSNQQGIQQLHSQQAKLEQTSITQNNLIAANQQEILKSQQITLANQKQNTQQAKGITSNQQGVQQLHSQQAKLEQTSITQNKLITSNQQDVTQLQQQQKNTLDTAKINAQHVTENKEAIHLQQSIALKDELVMSANNHAIKQEQSDIATNSDAIAHNQTEIKGLRKDMENMAKNIDGAYAESAAFSGLVDPYGVGNIAVTAALGYHGDAEAVAVGIGERFNENLTAKMGGAYDTATDSLSAYAGVGYEF